MKTLKAFTLLCVGAICSTGACAAGLEVTESGKTPDLKVTITAPGVYKAAVWQSYGGGIAEFYDLAVDPEAKLNLPGSLAGLFQLGWHGASWKRPEGADPKTCCVSHSLGGDPTKPCTDGNRDWPGRDHKEFKAEGELQVMEKSVARVRVRAQSWCTGGGAALRVDKDLPVTAVYTFYPSGAIFIQVRIQRTGTLAMHWSGEYGPHLFVGADNKNAEADLGFTWSTPEQGAIEGEHAPAKSEALVLATSEKAKTRLLLTIPPEEQTLFTRNMRHNGRSVAWDRCGYGSSNLVMQPGYDNTWACMIEMGTSDNRLVPGLKTAKEAVAYATDYREPAKITGVTLVTDDSGDFNKDGFNESEGCYVIKGPGPVTLTYEKGKGAGYAPAFKVLSWKGEAPRTIKVDGMPMEAAAAVMDGNLVLQVMGTIAGEKVKMEIGG